MPDPVTWRIERTRRDAILRVAYMRLTTTRGRRNRDQSETTAAEQGDSAIRHRK
jgi:hypothetical protein